MSQLALDARSILSRRRKAGARFPSETGDLLPTNVDLCMTLQQSRVVHCFNCFCSAVPRGEAPFFNMAFTFRYYDVRMPQEPLHIEDVSGTPSGQRILRLRRPIVLTNFFEFQSMVRGNTSRHLVLDLTAVPYIDSAGIGALVGAYVNHQKDGRSLALVGVTQRVRDAMEVTRVEQFFHFHDTVESAQGTPGKP